MYKKGYDLLCNQINEILNVKDLENDIESNKKNDTKEVTTDLSSFTKKNNFNNKKNNFSKYNNEIKLDSNTSKKNILNKRNKRNSKKREGEKNNYYIEKEINTFSYSKALKNDKRTYFQYYLSLIRTKHILLFTFYPNKDYNLYIIKICLFFFSIALYLVINALFFNDSMMHIIYENKGFYNFVNILPQIIYCIIICSIIFILIKQLSLSQKNILEIKHEKNKFKLKGRVLIVIRCLIIKFICFFILSIIFLILFWFYLSCFCIVYKNSQIFLIKNFSICYIISLIYPFIIYLIPGIFRIPSLRRPGECLFKVSQIIQLI